jgi:hypothetical protein
MSNYAKAINITSLELIAAMTSDPGFIYGNVSKVKVIRYLKLLKYEYMARGRFAASRYVESSISKLKKER